MLRLRVALLAVFVFACPTGRALADPPPGQTFQYDDGRRPDEPLLRRYIGAGGRASMPKEQVAALETYLANRDVNAATSYELQARFVKTPPSDALLAQLSNPQTAKAAPQNVKDAVWSFEYNKPMDQMTIGELRFNIARNEAAQAGSRQPGLYNDGLQQLRSLLGARRAADDLRGNKPGNAPGTPPLAGGTRPQAPASTPGGAPQGGDAPAAGPGGGSPADSGGGGGPSLASMGAPNAGSGGGADGGGASIDAGQAAMIQNGANAGNNGAAVGKMGGALKSAFDDGGRADAGTMNQGAGAAMNLGGAGSKPGQASPTSDANLALGAATYSKAFEKNGLRVAAGPDGKPAVVDAAGRPATESQRQVLLADIRAEPSAMARDPYYFTPAKGGISRGDYDVLKDTYKKDSGKRSDDFKHIVLTPLGEEKDFTRSESCELVTGACNRHAQKSYEKGDDVPAGDLSRIVASLRNRLLAANDRTGRVRGAGSKISGLGERLGGMMGRLASALGLSSGGGAGAPGGGADAGAPAPNAAAGAAGAAQAGADGGGAAGASSLSLAATLSSTPARLALFGFGTLGALLVLGAAFVIFKRDRKSFNR